MSTNTAMIQSLLEEGLRTVFVASKLYPAQYKEIYKTYKSDKAMEIDVEMRDLGLADLKPEGSPSSSDYIAERFKTNYIHRTISLMTSITMEAVEDNLYQSEFNVSAAGLKNGHHVAKDILGANPLNNAFNVAYPIGDGQPICSVNHPIDGDVYANTFGVNTAFSEAGLEAAIIAIQGFKSQSGLLLAQQAQKLVLPRQLQFNASRLLNSKLRTGTANNDINAIYHDDYMPQGYTINQYITNANAWFILTNADNGFKHYQRQDVKIDSYTDFTTKSYMLSALQRYSFGISDPRAVFGSRA